jgi:predicted ribosome quality control (RQC) complex YloA/Tae2 family protein
MNWSIQMELNDYYKIELTAYANIQHEMLLTLHDDLNENRVRFERDETLAAGEARFEILLTSIEQNDIFELLDICDDDQADAERIIDARRDDIDSILRSVFNACLMHEVLKDESNGSRMLVLRAALKYDVAKRIEEMQKHLEECKRKLSEHENEVERLRRELEVDDDCTRYLRKSEICDDYEERPRLLEFEF